jgi:tRNA G18 (ribose-2'-O)-methylase SpoU
MNAEINIDNHSEALEAIKKLKRQKYNIYALEKTNNSIDIKKFQPEFPFALIAGNEEFGISGEILKISDKILNIDMLGVKNSINVAVALGIAVFELTRNL